VVVIPGSEGIEVLMVRRPLRGAFAGAWVFPGGTVDEADHHPPENEAGDREEGDEEKARDESLGTPYRRAAVRELAEEVGIVVPTDSLAFISRWITPEIYPRRFDTHFFLAPMDEPRALVLAVDELEEAAYVTPAAALEAHHADRWDLVLPTLAHLRWLSEFATVEEVLEATRRDRTPRAAANVVDGSIVATDLPW
jgi:8-oxo-dGTP pyrophosphatase MutT (NUDIX family)